MNFAAAAQRDNTEKPLRVVQIDGHVVLKVIKHCQDCSPSLVTGQLLGLDVGATLEVTDCFPFPTRTGEEDDSADTDGASYQLDMMRCLRDVNVDNNTVGWYQSTVMGSYQTVELIDTFINYQETIKRCVCIVYDPQRSASGGLALKAVRLKDSFVAVYKDGNTTAEKLKAGNISWKDVFEEIPIHVHNSTLVTALMLEIQPPAATTAGDHERLALAVAPRLERNLEFLNDCLDDVTGEQQKVSFYHRNLARQQQQLAAWQAKRRQENAARRAAGEEPLPEEDPVQFKPLPEPSQLDSYLLTNQIANYCDQLNTLSGQTLHKVMLLQSLQETRV